MAHSSITSLKENLLDPYQPTSSNESKTVVILGIAVAVKAVCQLCSREELSAPRALPGIQHVPAQRAFGHIPIIVLSRATVNVAIQSPKVSRASCKPPG